MCMLPASPISAHKAELDDIFDRMVHVRDRMAKKMGYKNFVELGYYRMGRLCYDEEKVCAFRENILRVSVSHGFTLLSERIVRVAQ